MPRRFLNQSDLGGYLSSGEEDNVDSDVDVGEAPESSDEESSDDEESSRPASSNSNMPSTSTPTTNQAAADGTAAYNLQRDRPLNPTDMPFIGQPGIKVRHTNGLTPFGFLKLFLTTTIMQTIIDETNRFGLERHGDDWEKLSDKDMWRFFALIILMAVNKKPKITSYWSTNPNYHQPIFGNTLSSRVYCWFPV